MIKKTIQIAAFFYCCTLAPSCNHSHETEGLKAGDILFQNLNCGEICEATEEVTKGIDGKDFSHCAFVVNINDILKVIEAIGETVQVNSLENFFARSGDTAKIENITVERVKHQYEHLILKATLHSKKLIG